MLSVRKELPPLSKDQVLPLQNYTQNAGPHRLDHLWNAGQHQPAPSDQDPDTSPREPLLFFDIETTGLSRDRSMVYLIGCIVLDGGRRTLRQWMAENGEEERDILREFVSFAAPYSHVLHYNGKHFDIPFLEYRLLKHGLDSPFPGKYSTDLYQELRPCKALLQLEHLHQPDVEAFLDRNRTRLHCDGGECIPLYRKYRKCPSEALSVPLLGHNAEDLEGLTQLIPALSYPAFLRGRFHIEKCWAAEDTFHCICELDAPVPVPVTFAGSDAAISLKDHRADFSVPLSDQRLRFRHEDYRDYVYLPEEDAVIPKAMRSFVPPSQRIPATRENCYTWFPCSEDFLDDPEEVYRYLSRQLPLWV
mgnify:CR=1 FL=1